MIRTPIISFDDSNPEHIKDFVTYYNTKSLAACNNRYALEGNYGDVVSMMSDKFIKFCINNQLTQTN